MNCFAALAMTGRRPDRTVIYVTPPAARTIYRFDVGVDFGRCAEPLRVDSRCANPRLAGRLVFEG